MNKGSKGELKPEDVNVLGVIGIKLSHWTGVWKEKKGDNFLKPKVCVCKKDVGTGVG